MVLNYQQKLYILGLDTIEFPEICELYMHRRQTLYHGVKSGLCITYCETHTLPETWIAAMQLTKLGSRFLSNFFDLYQQSKF